MKVLIGKKIGMTQRFQPDGTVVPVTVLEAGPCVVSGVRTPERDGYSAVQLAAFPTKERRVKKPVRGQLKDLGHFRTLREFRLEKIGDIARGQTFDASIFVAGDRVQVTASSKGKGFAGVVKRHHFRGGPASHGHKDNLRMPGSIGATFPQHVTKGTRMAGRMGGERVTVKNLRVVDVVADQHLVLVSGAVPGARNGTVLIREMA
jgi:large subunit ribosomal protein L3